MHRLRLAPVGHPPMRIVPAIVILVTAARLGAADRVEFNRDIRPILADTCFQCHGPDRAKRKADLRFDTEEGALADLGGHRAIVPGQPERSEMWRRITAETGKKRMPPLASGRTLSEEQIALLGRWIEQGAKWQKHWSLIPPARPALPTVKNDRWPRNPVDRWILARLESEGFAPAPEAEKTTLLRRL